MGKDAKNVDLNELSDTERLAAVSAVLLQRQMNQAAADAEWGHGLAALEEVAMDQGRQMLCQIMSQTVRKKSLAEKGGDMPSRANVGASGMPNVGASKR